METEDRICISGIGIASPLGCRPSDVWKALDCDEQSVVGEIPEFNPSQYVKRRFLRPLDRVTLNCIAMVGAAIQDAGLELFHPDPSRVGIAIGSMFAGIGCIFDFKKACYEGRAGGYGGLSPLYFPGIVFNSLSGQPAIEFGYTGPNLVVNAGFSSGLLAVIKGAEYIRSGQADVMIAGGAEMSHPFIRRKFELEKSDLQFREYGDELNPSEAVCLFVLHKESDDRFPMGNRYGTLIRWASGFSPSGKHGAGWSKAICSVVGRDAGRFGSVVLDGYPDSPAYLTEQASLAGFPESVRMLANKRNFGHSLGASGALNLFHGLMFSRNRDGGRPFLVDSVDPNGNFAFLTVSGGADYER